MIKVHPTPKGAHGLHFEGAPGAGLGAGLVLSLASLVQEVV